MAAATTTKTTQRNTQTVEELTDRTRELNERIISAGKQAGETYLRTYERMLKSVADLQEEAGKASPIEWVSTVATAQANFTRDIAEAYAAAGRQLVK
jgi:hypothetical protein